MLLALIAHVGGSTVGNHARPNGMSPHRTWEMQGPLVLKKPKSCRRRRKKPTGHHGLHGAVAATGTRELPEAAAETGSQALPGAADGPTGHQGLHGAVAATGTRESPEAAAETGSQALPWAADDEGCATGEEPGAAASTEPLASSDVFSQKRRTGKSLLALPAPPFARTEGCTAHGVCKGPPGLLVPPASASHILAATR